MREDAITCKRADLSTGTKTACPACGEAVERGEQSLRAHVDKCTSESDGFMPCTGRHALFPRKRGSVFAPAAGTNQMHPPLATMRDDQRTKRQSGPPI